MEHHDLSLIEKISAEDPEIKDLWVQHQEFERMIEKLEAKPYLSPTQTQEIKQLKKKKLAGKTKLQFLLDKHREKKEA
ncbi:MAG: DUF465 domain-containing protein [Desulfovibrionaceae bacterium]